LRQFANKADGRYGRRPHVLLQKTLRFFENYGMSAWIREMGVEAVRNRTFYGQEEEGQSCLRFYADDIYGRPLTVRSLRIHII